MFTLSGRLLTSCAVFMMATPAFAYLSDTQLRSRLEYLSQFTAQGLDLLALEREAAYERANLPVEQRALLEGQLMVRQLRDAAIQTYEVEIKEGRSKAAAMDAVMAAVDEDLNLVAPQMRADVKAIVLDALKKLDRASMKPEVPATLLNNLFKLSQERLAILSQGAYDPRSEMIAKSNKQSSDEKNRTFSSRASFAQALVDDQTDSESWVSSANSSARSGKTNGHDEEFSAQVGVEFLGVKIAAGPVFNFRKFVSTFVDIKGNGFYPLFDAKGAFDLVQRGSNGKPLMANGKPVRRFMTISCEAEATVTSEQALRGGFKVFESGVEGQVTLSFTSNVSLSSRRVFVPESIEGQVPTVNMLASLCHKDFMAARSSNGRTVKQNLDTTIRNLVSSATYVNPLMNCANDNHCIDWYNKKVLTIHKNRTIPRCIQEKNNPGVMACRVRGSDRANCTVVKSGKRVSNGYFEYTCDRGYTCQTIEQGRWGGFLNTQWFPATGRCISDVAYINL